jgi:hypothetical protein
MRIFITLLFLACFFITNAKKPKHRAKLVEKNDLEIVNDGTQGYSENKKAKDFFHENSKRTEYNRFTGRIEIIDEKTIKFDEEVLFIKLENKSLKGIFENGIFYPELITGPVQRGLARKAELDSMLFRNDSLLISDFEELKFLNKSPNVKKFRFWVFSKGAINPTVCFLEFVNDKATSKTDLETFILNSTLTFFKVGWLIN